MRVRGPESRASKGPAERKIGGRGKTCRWGRRTAWKQQTTDQAPHLVGAMTLGVWGPEVHGHGAVIQRVQVIELSVQKTGGRSLLLAVRSLVAPLSAKNYETRGTARSQ